MTEADWSRSDDAGTMLDVLWQQRGIAPGWRGLPVSTDLRETDAAECDDLDRALHRFYVASGRGIWPLLVQADSRRAIELAEQFLAGAATAAQLNEHEYDAEAAAFTVDYETAPEAIARWVAKVRALPPDRLRALLHPPATADRVETRELLKRAAYFAHYAMTYPSIRPPGPPPASYRPFLSAVVLRRYVGYPGPRTAP